MLITNHVLSGALVGAASPGPASALGAGVASHFALDSVPHWGEGVIEDFMHVAVTDGLVGLAAIAVVAARTPRRHRLRVLAGITGACLPDLDKPGRVFFGRSPFPAAVDAFHVRIQRESSRRMPQEVLVALTQAAVLAVLARRSR
ncbi:hypothetical protein GCM10011519_22280 [Marmoricola endophyticus]|uniref:DUF4184 family protein n=1 Tax=Marmoricola endophyticus TaxID=2040280 RepID=A0A917BJ29_9ACTN|nr:hypothetical protein [Marmoricola endophyticus]GGF47766.1 hypothetical protein GCM10011519_22280 [Marmoricola endophyticus]